jgi:hypothetical protein|tara:strand:- start:99 stop:401 length:303 start_codon:yes stop_codon:yes gene_type:complete
MSLKGPLKALPARAVAALIQAYRYGLSPLLPPRCRYAPSCSEYALEAVLGHGAVKGIWLGLKRIFRCHPWGGDGYDPVPGSSSRAPSGGAGNPDQQARGA